ncbi:MAG: PHP domain-containing protein [Armatimonadota bacterium]
MAEADLHVHSTASDGRLRPAELVRMAAEKGLAAIALCDHDSTDGLDEALEEGPAAGVEVVPGVEINTDCGPTELHVLGYFVDHHNDALQSALCRLRGAREERGKRMVERLREIGVRVDFDQVLRAAKGGAVGRPHVAMALVEAGYAADVNAAFGKYLVRGAPGYVERVKFKPAEAVQLVLDAGGVPGIAHPAKIGNENLWIDLIPRGLRCVEVYHPDHSAADVRRYRRMARRRGLLVTGGSDYHGPGVGRFCVLGQSRVPYECVELLRAEALRRRES